MLYNDEYVNQFYITVATATTSQEALSQLKDFKKKYGELFFNTLITAYYSKGVQEFESKMEIPPRSGKAVMALCSSVLKEHYSTAAST